MIYFFGLKAETGLPAEALAKAGRSIPVVQVLWEHLDWVQFPAARMTALALLFTLSAIGISETVYLVRQRIASEKPVCPIGKGCEIVLNSRYKKIFLLPNDAWGLIVYILISLLCAFLVIEVPLLPVWSLFFKILVGFASIMSLVFTYLQWRVIHAWCFWCLMSAFTIWLMEIIILLSKNI